MKFLERRFYSFKYAFKGLLLVLKTEENIRIHMVISAIVLLLAAYLKVSPTDWVFLIIAVFMVTSAEVFNTSIEHLGDAVTKEKNKYIGAAKDVAAAAVLISSVGAVVIGLIVLLPYLINFFK